MFRLIFCSLIIDAHTLDILINLKLVIMTSLETLIDFFIFLFLYG